MINLFGVHDCLKLVLKELRGSLGRDEARKVQGTGVREESKKLPEVVSGRGCVVEPQWRVPWNQEFGDVKLGPIYSVFAVPFCPITHVLILV